MPARRSPNGRRGPDTEQPVLIADGGSEDDEDWKWNPAVDEEPTIESSGSDRDPSEEDERTSPERSTSQHPSHPQQPREKWEADERAPQQPGPHQESDQPDNEPLGGREESTDSRRISRRALLVGGAGLAGTAAVTGSWLVSSSQRTGAKAVAETYLSAIGANDWERAASTYHEDASPIRAIERENSTDDYESYLAINDRLALYEALEPTIDSIEVLEYFPDLNAETTDQSFLAPSDHSGLDSWKLLVVILTVDIDTLTVGRRGETYAEALAGEQTKEIMLIGTVSETREWFLWDTSSQL